MKVLCTIEYASSSGEVSERPLAHVRPSTFKGCIDAFCLLRAEDRSFKITSISKIFDEQTKTYISDPWQYFGIGVEDYEGEEWQLGIDRLTWRARSAIVVLKFFALTTRGLAKREQSKLIAFVRETSLVEKYSNEQLGVWLKQIWCADIYEYHRGNITKYQALLDAVPYSLIPTLRVHAAMLAGGSGRKPIKSFWAARIESEFNSNPQALIPPPNIETNDYPHRTA